MHWFLLKTKPRAHFIARENLKRQGFEVFLPLLSKTTRKRQKFVNNTTPLFPGYLFIGTSLNEVSWKSINATRGVAKAVTLDGKYRNINPEIIQGLKSRCDAMGIIQHVDEVVSGDRVKIERGPFANFICLVDKIVDNQRAWVLIEILHQQTRANVAIFDISKVG